MAIKKEYIDTLQKTFLFEISWEVCNKVGGIYTVLRSKLKEVLKYFQHDHYVLIGPLLEKNSHFSESKEGMCGKIAQILDKSNIACKVGYWETEGRPITILVDFKNRYKIDVLLYNLWADYRVDSLASNYDYQEPILFATAAGEVIEILEKSGVMADCPSVLAHFHEWLCGAGLLYVKKHCDAATTIFTTHATVLGRALSSNGTSIYNLPKNFDATAEARKLGVFAKHSLERAAAREAHCFTTVSSLTADEAYLMLGKFPDQIIFNGLDITKKATTVITENLGTSRKKMLAVASRVLGKQLPDNTLLFVTSGRYEFHNKGFDVLLRALAALETRFSKANIPPIVVFFLVAANLHTKQDSLFESDWVYNPGQKNALGIATHQIHDPENDRILNLCHELNLTQSERKIRVVYSDAYLNGSDGVFDMIYEQALAASDFSMFPSFYEPWGYTPLESIAESIPTITTDLAGFGNWVQSLSEDYKDAVYALKRKGVTDEEFINILTDCLENVVKQCLDAERSKIAHAKAFELAKLADWEHFYEEYLYAYYQAMKFNEIYHNKFDTTISESKFVTAIYAGETLTPRFRSFQYDSPLPKKLQELREVAYNFWWAWHEEGKLLFQRIDEDLWEKVKHNPVLFLNEVSSSVLQKAAADDDYVRFYEKTLEDFHDYRKENPEIIKFCNAAAIDEQHPIAYFCMEYGIDECLPIYSGGLGILAGDYLKVMSDLRVPFIAIGLFYKQGYFLQNINVRGDQVALYETWNKHHIPMRSMGDENGKPILIGVNILDRVVYAKIWEVQVGYIKLYLLDTDVPENNAEDREITNSLYGGSREIRLQQEIILGIGGAKFILEKLKIQPALYHLNEGHSAFLLLERLRNYHHQGMAIDNAIELVRCTSIFTTHTPVPAGNEEFSEGLIRKYFTNYAEGMSLPFEDLMALAQNETSHKGNGSSSGINIMVEVAPRNFSMTALALRLCAFSNAVSALHGKVARAMWQGIWPGLLPSEVPITHITNGIHLATWLGPNMRKLYQDYLYPDWLEKQDESKVWKEIMLIPGKELWAAHQEQKRKLIDLVRDMVLEQYSLRNESKHLINATLNCLHEDTLLLGLARRFTSYKRNDLVLKDKERLASILTNNERPIVLLIAGKAHPMDTGGNNLIRDIISALREDMFNGHIIFLEEYNIALAKSLVQGVDVWLNTPILGHEACGTSGMKVGINGGLNFSTRDGWWDEAYNHRLGWEVESAFNIADIEKRNDIESMFLLNKLETEVAGLYYAKRKGGYNDDWVNKEKISIALIASKFNMMRMAKDYINDMYCHSLSREEQMIANNYHELYDIVKWKEGIGDLFNTVKIKAVLIEGVKENKILEQGLIKVKVLLFSGKLTARELKTELVLTKLNGKTLEAKPIVMPLKLTDSRESGILNFEVEYKVEDTGVYSYGVRVFPYNEKLLYRYEAGIIYWG